MFQQQPRLCQSRWCEPEVVRCRQQLSAFVAPHSTISKLRPAAVAQAVSQAFLHAASIQVAGITAKTAATFWASHVAAPESTPPRLPDCVMSSRAGSSATLAFCSWPACDACARTRQEGVDKRLQSRHYALPAFRRLTTWRTACPPRQLLPDGFALESWVAHVACCSAPAAIRNYADCEAPAAHSDGADAEVVCSGDAGMYLHKVEIIACHQQRPRHLHLRRAPNRTDLTEHICDISGLEGVVTLTPTLPLGVCSHRGWRSSSGVSARCDGPGLPLLRPAAAACSSGEAPFDTCVVNGDVLK